MVCLAGVLLLTLSIRLSGLNRHGYALDEVWSMEIANGRGSTHEHLPLNRIVSHVPSLSTLAGAAPWWRIWSNVEVTHPPLYPVLLRWWEETFGDGDAAGRWFSVGASLVAVGLLFDVVQLQMGLPAAVWAGLLLALATPQIEHARLARSYTLLAAAALAAADAMVRILVLGLARRRWWALTGALLATLLTHYFCLGTLLGLTVIAIAARRDLRRPLLVALASAATIFAVAWGPFMWRQRHLFSTDDPNTLFLTAAVSNHVALTALRIALAPVAVLLPYPTGSGIVWAAPIGLALLLLPLLPAVRRRCPWAPFWWCWTWGTMALVATLDLGRGTNHLAFPRYVLLAGPGVCALLPALLAPYRRRWPTLLLSAISIAACASAVPAADVYPFADPRSLVAELPAPPGPNDLLIFAAEPDQLVGAESAFLSITRYLPRPTCRAFAVLTRPADAGVISAARQSRSVFLVTSASDYRAYLPDATVIGAARHRGLGNVWVLRYADKNVSRDVRPNATLR